jgi:ribose-phosphate pyrophosphokinase
MPKKLKIFSGTAHPELAKKIAEYLDIPLGKVDIGRFADGEISVKFQENIRGTDLFLVQPTPPPAENLLELLIMMDAAKRASASRITAVIPYFGYARQDRKDEGRVPITAKLVADLMTSAGAERIISMDLHAAQIQGFFNIPFDHLYASAVLIDYVRNRKLENLVMVSPDVGSLKMARAYARRLGSGYAMVDKVRKVANVAHAEHLIGDVEGKDAMIVDDMVDTGGSVVGTAEILRDRGVRRIEVACTHALLSDNAWMRMQESEVDHFAACDTLPPINEKGFAKYEVVSVAKLFAEAIRRTHNEESISTLFV